MLVISRRQYQRTALESITASLEHVDHVDFDGGIAPQAQDRPGRADIGDVENAVPGGQRSLRRKTGRSVFVGCRDERQYRRLDCRPHVGSDFIHGQASSPITVRSIVGSGLSLAAAAWFRSRNAVACTGTNCRAFSPMLPSTTDRYGGRKSGWLARSPVKTPPQAT